MIATLAGAFCLLLLAVQIITVAIAAIRMRPRRHLIPIPSQAPAVSIVRPLHGLEAFSEATLASSYALDYRAYELIFCVADPSDPILPLVRAAIAAHPAITSRLVLGDEKISDNPKLNNCVLGWDIARHPWIILADSNVLLPRDYVQRLLANWKRDTGLICSTPIGSHPRSIWADLECAFLNTLQARWQYAGEALGLGFAQGKSMLWRRDILEREGGIRALAAEIAEDAAATKLVRKAGLRVHLVSEPFLQPLGARTLRAVIDRQIRWARLRRVTFPPFYALEVFLGAVTPLIAGLIWAMAGGHSLPGTLLGVAIAFYGPEALLAWRMGWRLPWSFPALGLLRDALLMHIWASGWFVDAIVWQGNAMTIGAKGGRREHSLAGQE